MPQEYDLVDSENDREIRPTLIVKTLHIKEPSIGTERFTKYSTWRSLVSGIARLKHVARCWSGTIPCRGWQICNKAKMLTYILKQKNTSFEQSRVKLFEKRSEVSEKTELSIRRFHL